MLRTPSCSSKVVNAVLNRMRKASTISILCSMGKRGYTVGAVIGAIALGFLPFWYQMSAGLVVGYVSSLLYLRFLAYRVDRILARERVDIWAYLGMLIGLAMLGLPLLLAVANPEHLSWIGVLIGLTARKASLYIDAIRGGVHDL